MTRTDELVSPLKCAVTLAVPLPIACNTPEASTQTTDESLDTIVWQRVTVRSTPEMPVKFAVTVGTAVVP